MNKQNLLKQISVVAVCILLGFTVSVQMKSVRVNTSQNSAARNEELQKLLGAEKEKTTALQDQINQMQTTIENYRTSIEQTGSAYAGLQSDLQRAENLAGLTEVHGSGISVTLEDAKMPEGAISPELYILHDSDVRTVVNELLAAGAEGISINGERIIATSAIRCVGPAILINNTRTSTPLVIKAIGDPTSLENALNMNGGILSELRGWNYGVSIQKLDEVVLPAYSGTVSFRYLTPVIKSVE